MSRIAVLGAGPLQEEGVKFFSGQCLRTWHFTRPLLDAGHVVSLVTHPIDDRSFNPVADALTSEATFQGLRYRRLHSNSARPISAIDAPPR